MPTARGKAANSVVTRVIGPRELSHNYIVARFPDVELFDLDGKHSLEDVLGALNRKVAHIAFISNTDSNETLLRNLYGVRVEVIRVRFPEPSNAPKD